MPPKMTNFDTWRNLYWADLSGQLWALNTIDSKYFDNTLLLKTDSTNGAWLWRWLYRTYHQHSTTARESIIIDVLPPGPHSAGCVGIRLERQVRRHWSTTFETFPDVFEEFGEVKEEVKVEVKEEVKVEVKEEEEVKGEEKGAIKREDVGGGF